MGTRAAKWISGITVIGVAVVSLRGIIRPNKPGMSGNAPASRGREDEVRGTCTSSVILGISELSF